MLDAAREADRQRPLLVEQVELQRAWIRLVVVHTQHARCLDLLASVANPSVADGEGLFVMTSEEAPTMVVVDGERDGVVREREHAAPRLDGNLDVLLVRDLSGQAGLNDVRRRLIKDGKVKRVDGHAASRREGDDTLHVDATVVQDRCDRRQRAKAIDEDDVQQHQIRAGSGPAQDHVTRHPRFEEGVHLLMARALLGRGCIDVVEGQHRHELILAR